MVNAIDNRPGYDVTKLVMSLGAFQGIAWASVALCTVVFIFRLHIRCVCYRRLLVDDYFMMLSLVILFVTTILCQLDLRYIYNLEKVQNGILQPGPNLARESESGLRAFGAAVILYHIGIWAVKLSFLLFFQGLGIQATKYRIFWWVVLFFTIASGGASLRFIKYRCFFSSFAYIAQHCNSPSEVKSDFVNIQALCILDVLSDILIICFPISILWRTRVNLKKKIVLSCIFSLVLLTIAVTIIRGSLSGGVYRSLSKKHVTQLNPTWIWFWFFIELVVSFLIACLVSFRALFAQREQTADAKEKARLDQQHREEARVTCSPGVIARARSMHESFIETCKSFEGGEQTNHDQTGPEPHPSRQPSTA